MFYNRKFMFLYKKQAIDLWNMTNGVFAKSNKNPPALICTPKVSNFWGAYHSVGWNFFKRTFAQKISSSFVHCIKNSQVHKNVTI